MVCDYLRDQGIETFLPVLSKISQWKGRQKRIEWSLFRSWCFARFRWSETPHVLQLPGVVEMIGNAARPVSAIPDEQIAALHRVMKSGRVRGAQPIRRDGILTEIIRGPLRGVRGILIQHPSPSRLIIPITLIRQGAVVDLEADDIANIQAPSESGE